MEGRDVSDRDAAESPNPRSNTDEVTEQDAGLTGRGEESEVPADRVPRQEDEVDDS